MVDFDVSKKECKQLLIVRNDLKMPKGKIASQCAHASGKVFFDKAYIGGDTMYVAVTPPMIAWISGSFTKVVCKVDSEQELVDLYELAKSKGIACSLIVDEGRTCFNGVATSTVVAIGPDFNNIVDSIAGHLKLL